MKERESGVQEHRMDEALASPAQRQIAQMIQALPTDEPSSVWTASLNERLYVLAEKKRRRQWWTSILQPVAGVSFAGALALLFLMNPGGPTPQAAGNLEAKLLSAHKESVSVTDLSGAGLASHEVELKSISMPVGYDWHEVDLGAL
jgi:hypothetical protein